MFHLLVKSGGWGTHSDSLPLSRAVTSGHTFKRLVDFYRPDGVFSIPNIGSIPAIFMPEIGDDVPPIATIGRITNVVTRYRDAIISYSIDTTIPPIELKKFVALVPELGLTDFQLIHSHWSIHDADLFEVLLKNNIGEPTKPIVFNIQDLQNPKHDQLSVMMPFTGKSGLVYEALRGMAAEMGMACNRADDIWNHDAIIQDVVSLICQSEVVICDLSGKNPNVFYEVGIAHALGKKVILIAQNLEDVPFDLRHLRVIIYHPNGEGIEDMISQVRPRLSLLVGKHFL